MKTIKKVTIFIITCVFAVALYFSFGAKKVDAANEHQDDGVAAGLTYDLSAQLTITSNFEFAITVSDNGGNNSIKECVLTYYEYDKNDINKFIEKTLSETYTENYPSSITFYVPLSAAVMWQQITIKVISNEDKSNTLNTTGFRMINNILNYETNTKRKAVLNDLIIYVYYVCKYHNTAPVEAPTFNETQIGKVWGTEAADLEDYALTGEVNNDFKNNDKLHITSVNFECSCTGKVQVFITGLEGTDYSKYKFADETGNPYYSVVEGNKLKVVIDFQFSLLDSAKSLCIYAIDDTNCQTSLISYDVYGLTYAYVCLNKYETLLQDDQYAEEHPEVLYLAQVCRSLNVLAANVARIK